MAATQTCTGQLLAIVIDVASSLSPLTLAAAAPAAAGIFFQGQGLRLGVADGQHCLLSGRRLLHDLVLVVLEGEAVDECLGERCPAALRTTPVIFPAA